MYADDRGDMGFLESMIATMAVILVLTAFLGLAVGAAGIASDPTEGLDPDRVTGEIVDGEFVPAFQDYIEEYLGSRGLSGASVTVTVPGRFCVTTEPFVIGSTDGAPWSRSLTSVIGCDGGREVLAVFEVVLCARTTADSSPWWTPCCSSSS